MTIGKRLKKARKDSGLTQKQLSSLSGVDQGRISALECDAQKSSGQLNTLCLHLAVDPIYIETGKNEIDRKPDLSPMDLELLKLLKSLSDDERAREVAFMQKLVQSKSKL